MTTSADVARAARVVAGGGVVLYPAETVYGLGGDARRPDVAARIHVLKGSDPGKPLLALTDAWERVEAWVEAPAPVRRLWGEGAPSPLTLVLPATAAAPRALVSADGFVGIRRTTSAPARALIEATGTALFSTSANPSGAPPPDRLGDVDAAIRRGVDATLDAGQTLDGHPSTLARFDPRRVRFEVLRAGPVSAEAIAQASGVGVGEGALACGPDPRPP